MRTSMFSVFFLVGFLWLGCAGNNWPSPLPETRLDSIMNSRQTRDGIIKYLHGKYSNERPLVMEDTIRGEDFWPVFICGIPGRLYISEWNPGPLGIADNIEGMGFSWVAFGSHQVDSLGLGKWVPADVSSLNRLSLFQTLAVRLKTEYKIQGQTYQDSRYSFAFNILGGKLRFMREVQDTLIEIQFYNARSR